MPGSDLVRCEMRNYGRTSFWYNGLNRHDGKALIRPQVAFRGLLTALLSAKCKDEPSWRNPARFSVSAIIIDVWSAYPAPIRSAASLQIATDILYTLDPSRVSLIDIESRSLIY